MKHSKILRHPVGRTLSNLSIAHFLPPENEEHKRYLFKSVVNIVGIEINSFCNRRCKHCPNSFLDRSFEEFFPENMYISTLEQLKKIDYSGLFAFQHYNEPTANRSLLIKRIEQAKQYIPHATLVCNTNGDYLNRSYCHELSSAGLNRLLVTGYIDTYDDNDDDDEAQDRCLQKSLDERIAILDLAKEFQSRGQYSKFVMLGNLEISVRATNFLKATHSVNRGGLLDNLANRVKRNAPCVRPFSSFSIEYNGNVMPCANMRSDAEDHKKFVMGNVFNENIFSIFYSEKFCDLRKKLTFFSNTLMHPCNSCALERLDDKEKDFVSHMLSISYNDYQEMKKKNLKIRKNFSNIQSELDKIQNSKWYRLGKKLKLL